MFIDSMERGKERNRKKHRCERETLIGQPSICTLTGD